MSRSRGRKPGLTSAVASSIATVARMMRMEMTNSDQDRCCPSHGATNIMKMTASTVARDGGSETLIVAPSRSHTRVSIIPTCAIGTADKSHTVHSVIPVPDWCGMAYVAYRRAVRLQQRLMLHVQSVLRWQFKCQKVM